MNEPKEREKQKVDDAAILEPGLISQFRALAHVLLVSPQRNAIVWLALGLAVVVGATAYAQIELNAWNQPFYDAINRKDLSGVGRQLGVYGIIAGALALGYPDPSSKYSNQEFISALEQLGLTQLVPSLDVVARWDHELRTPRATGARLRKALSSQAAVGDHRRRSRNARARSEADIYRQFPKATAGFGIDLDQ